MITMAPCRKLGGRRPAGKNDPEASRGRRSECRGAAGGECLCNPVTGVTLRDLAGTDGGRSVARHGARYAAEDLAIAIARGHPSRERARCPHDAAGRSPPDPLESAQAAGLRYVSDTIARDSPAQAGRARASPTSAPDGRTVRDKATLARIRSLAIPPAYTDVWICPIPNGHLQATGRDARGTQAVPLPPEVARGPGRDQVRPDAGLQRGAAAAAGPGRGGPGQAGAARGEGAGDRGAAARVHRASGWATRSTPGPTDRSG